MPRPFPHHFGWAGPGLPDIRDRIFAARREVLEALPPSVDLSQPAPGPPFDPVYDQGSIGSCGPNTIAGDLCLDLIAEPGGPDPRPSRLFIYYTTRMLMGTVNQDSGVQNRTMLKALNKHGWCDESLWPYIPSKYQEKPPDEAFLQAIKRQVLEYESVPQDLDQMRGCLASGEPFVFGFSVYSSMQTDAVSASGDIPMPTRYDQMVGGHDTMIVGYNDSTQRFKLRNSWGPSWGQNGYGTIPYAYATHPRLASDFWMIQRSAFTPPPPAPLPPVDPEAPVITVPKAGKYQWVGA